MGVFFSLGPLQDPCVQYYNRGGGVYRDPKFVLRNRWTAPLYKLTHLRQTLSSWKLCYRLFFARRPKHEIDLIFRQVNFQLGKLLENFEKKMSAKHFGCNKP